LSAKARGPGAEAQLATKYDLQKRRGTEEVHRIWEPGKRRRWANNNTTEEGNKGEKNTGEKETFVSSAKSGRKSRKKSPFTEKEG